MRCTTARLLAPVVLVAGLAMPVVHAPPAVAATVVKKVLSPNAGKLKLSFDAGQHAEVAFSGIHNEAVHVVTSAGTYANNCDVMVSVKKGATVIAGPICGGQSGTSAKITLPADATYTIVVDPGASPAGSLKLSLTSTGVKKSITPNAAAVTIASKAGTTTNLRFIGVAGTRLSLTTTGTFIEQCDVHASILAPDGSTIVGSILCAGSLSFLDAVDGLGAGTYTLRVENAGAVDGSLALAVYQFEDASQPIATDGVAVSSTIKFPGQNAKLTFAGAVGQKVSFRVSGGPIAGGGSTHWQRPDGSTVGGTCLNTNCFQDATVIDVAGTWSVVIDPSGLGTGSASVQLFTFTDVEVPIVPNGGAATLTLALPGQNGGFTFSGTSGQKVAFLVTNSSIVSGSVRLVRSDGATLGGTCIVNDCFQDSVTLFSTGTWEIFVDPVGASTGTLHVELYTFSDVSGGPIVANGAPASLSTTIRGQNGSFTFSGTTGQKVAFEVMASTIATGSVHLQAPSGEAVAGTCILKDCFQDSVTLDATGLWRIVVDPGGISTGSISVELTSFNDVNGGALLQGGSAKSLTITTRGQNGFFTFTGSVGQMAGFEVTATTMRGGSVYFQKPDGTKVGGTCIRKFCTQAPITLDVAGTWKIVVDPSGAAHGSVSVKLT